MRFVYLLALSAAVLVMSAAYFSVTGFAKLFSGAATSIIVLISGLELAKLVTTSFLYRYWDKISKIFKVYLLIAVITLMIITSAGIYGFLSSAYSVTADKLSQLDGTIDLYEKKKEIVQNNVDRFKSFIDNKSNRINILTTLRTNQEARIDTLYKKNLIRSVRKTEEIINNANSEIKETNKNIDSLSKQMQIQLDSISKIDITILQLKGNDIKGDIGPLKYIATLTNKSIDSVVNFFILLLVFISDPLAVVLVIATNKILLEQKVSEVELDESQLIKKIKEYFKKIKNISLW